jgi:hypothetical protein
MQNGFKNQDMGTFNKKVISFDQKLQLVNNSNQ